MQSMYCRFSIYTLTLVTYNVCTSDDKRRKKCRNFIQQNIFNDLHCPVCVQFVSGFVFEQVFRKDFKITTTTTTTTPDQKIRKIK